MVKVTIGNNIIETLDSLVQAICFVTIVCNRHDYIFGIGNIYKTLDNKLLIDLYDKDNNIVKCTINEI